MAQKILHSHGVEDVEPGSFGRAFVDLVLVNEVSGSVAMQQFSKMGAERVFDPSKIALVADHFVPAKDARSAELVAALRRFAREQGIDQYWEVGATTEAGIEHTLLAEEGLIRPGEFVPGGDSHTCTYGAFGAFGTGMGSTDIAAAMALGEVWVRVPDSIQVTYEGRPGPYVTGKDLILAYIGEVGVSGATYSALEFGGEAVAGLNIDERMALCNMSVEAGAKTGFVAADDVTADWLEGRVEGGRPAAFDADPGASYSERVTLDLDGVGPLVACPASPGNVTEVSALESVRVDQVYVGNCANGTMTDLRQLAQMLEGRTVAAGTRLIVVPATQAIKRQALREGIIETVLEAGGMLSAPTCGACFGGHMGIIAAGEVALATTNRNFRGRMGHRDSHVYLANAYVAGAAAVTGEIVDPAEVIGR
ncbi:MAG: 3-isopropylmalate dehydratase large subunit [Thermoleophilia bacterium]|nr:3-isopropylmalate dehydratase large subunit [Thermoleophilia bacterium]